MITLLIFIITFLLLIMLIVWGHFFRSNPIETDNENELRDQTNVQLYKEHQAEIEQDFAQGAIDEESYQYLLTELDKSLLQDMAATEKVQEKTSSSTFSKNISILWPIGITLFILIFSISLYQKQGAYQQWATGNVSTSQSNQQVLSEDQQAIAKVEQLKQALKSEPKNSELWYRLGQASISIADFDAAVNAFDQVIKIEGIKAELLGAKAQALYYRNNQQINDEIQQLIDQALALDPVDPATNILLGMHNFIQQDYAKAISYWQHVVNSGREDVNVEALNGAITEAKNRLASSKNMSNSSAQTNNNSVAQSTSGPQLTLNVSLSKQFEQALAKGDDKTLFVYAIPANGKRMPLAAMKLKTSDLPITVTLTNAQAMNPKFNLASAEKVNIYAIVSQLGTVGIKSGDYRAELKNVSVNTTEPIDLIINSLVP